jgi:hypothetical protein
MTRIGSSAASSSQVALNNGTVEIVEVLVVAEREGDVAYLLAGLRLGRLDDPVRRADAERSIARTRRRRPSPEKPQASAID